MRVVQPTVLVVDDVATERRLAGALVERTLGWQVIYANKAQAALAIMEHDPPDVVLTDLQMPGMDGLALVEAIRQRHPIIPVVLMTAFGSEEIAVRALRAGATSYVPKRRLVKDLAATLEQVLAAARGDQCQLKLLQCLTEMNCHFVLDTEPALIRALVVEIQRYLSNLRLGDSNDRMRIAIALEEALTNGLYHGNLEIDSELRNKGDEKGFRKLIEERRQTPPYQDRRLDVRVSFSSTRISFKIRDQGPGFDYRALPDPTDPAHLELPSGRGLVLIRAFMDEVQFNPAGNEITLVKFAQAQRLSEKGSDPLPNRL